MPHSHLCALLKRAPLVLVSSLLLMACQSGGESVVTPPTSTPNTASSPVASTTTTPGPEPASTTVAPPASPAVPPPSGARPDPFVSPGTQGKPSGTQRGGNITGMPGVTTQPYKPTPTPGDPFPPRPTPTLVIKDGKPVQEWQAPPEALALTNPVKGKPDAVRIGEGLYNQRCADCHGKRGYGNGPMSKSVRKVPTNLASRMVQANTDGELFWKITNGRSPMPANRVRFDDEQRWYIVSFLRSLK